MADEIEVQETQNTPEVEPETKEGEELSAEEIAELRRRASESSQNFERAKKAEAEAKALKDKASQVPQKDLSGEDVYALIEAKVHREDFDKVKDFAGYKKLSIADALKDKTLQTILSDSVEERQTAIATQSRSSRGSSKVTPESLMERARAGKVPESDEEIAMLARAKVGAK